MDIAVECELCAIGGAVKGSAQLGRRAIPNEQLVATAAVIPRGIIVVRRHDCAVIVLLRLCSPPK